MLDLVVSGGLVVDGSGRPGRRADVGVMGGRVVAVGEVDERGRRQIDADGCIVAPGFIDGHTHLDAQIFWDPVCASLSSHGVTTAVMGNCGFTLAPAGEKDVDLVLRSIERAEDMKRSAILAGVPWEWESFPEYLDAVDGLPKAFNCAAYVGHSALRAHVMGERAFEAPATEEEIAAMALEVEQSLRAGALGFSTSRSFNHLTFGDRPVASRWADWAEVVALAEVMGRLGGGVFQLAPERLDDPEQRRDFEYRLVELTRRTGRPATFMIARDVKMLEGLANEIASSGGRVVGQVHLRSLANVYSFQTSLPFDGLPSWKELRGLPLPEQQRRLASHELRTSLVDEAMRGRYGPVYGAEPKPPAFELMYPLGGDDARRSVASLAQQEETTPVDVIIDRAFATGFEQCFIQHGSIDGSNDLDREAEIRLALLRRADTVLAASDSGAHVSQILDSNIPGALLSGWVRERQLLGWEEAVRLLTHEPAMLWSLDDRGLLREGYRADLVVFDPDMVGSSVPRVVHDLPDGGPRLVQHGLGYDAIVVEGTVTWRDGNCTGDLPGTLIRGPLTPPCTNREG
jgi:N-acyl-D-aspartate/D-glutamate deacylase